MIYTTSKEAVKEDKGNQSVVPVKSNKIMKKKVDNSANHLNMKTEIVMTSHRNKKTKPILPAGVVPISKISSKNSKLKASLH